MWAINLQPHWASFWLSAGLSVWTPITVGFHSHRKEKSPNSQRTQRSIQQLKRQINLSGNCWDQNQVSLRYLAALIHWRFDWAESLNLQKINRVNFFFELCHFYLNDDFIFWEKKNIFKNSETQISEIKSEFSVLGQYSLKWIKIQSFWVVRICTIMSKLWEKVKTWRKIVKDKLRVLCI